MEKRKFALDPAKKVDEDEERYAFVFCSYIYEIIKIKYLLIYDSFLAIKTILFVDSLSIVVSCKASRFL